MTPQSLVIFSSVPLFLVVLVMKALVAFRRVSPILFSHLKYGLFLIFSKIWCIGSRNTVLTTWVAVDPDCPAKSLRGQLLLYLSDLTSLLSYETTLAFPFPCCWSSSTCLYSSMWSMSWRTLLTGFLVKDFLNSCSACRLILKVLIATSSKFPSISLNISLFHMVIDSKESKGQGTPL